MQKLAGIEQMLCAEILPSPIFYAARYSRAIHIGALTVASLAFSIPSLSVFEVFFSLLVYSQLNGNRLVWRP